MDNHITDHFTWAELTTTDTGLDNTPDGVEAYELVQTAWLLERVRALLGVPLVVTSGFRCEAVNRAIGGASGSQHREGRAADFIPQGMDVHEAVRLIRSSAIPFDQLICETPPGRAWVHISHAGYHDHPRRQALAFDGKTYKEFVA